MRRGWSNVRSAELVRVAQPIARCAESGGIGRRGEISQRRVRTPLVVILSPGGDPGPGMIEAEEQALIEQLVAHPAVEALAKSVLHRLARCDEAPGPDPEPAAVMPVWAFEPEDGSGDVLLSSAKLWGADLLVEALRVEDDDDPTPVPAVRERFRRWADAAGGGRALSTTRLPGREGSYVIFAAAAPA